MLQSNEEIHGVVSDIHSQESFTEFAHKVIPERCVPGLQVPMMSKEATFAWGKQYGKSAKLPFDSTPATMDMMFT